MSRRTEPRCGRRRHSRCRIKLKKCAHHETVDSQTERRFGPSLAPTCSKVKMFHLISLLLIIAAACCCACWPEQAGGLQSQLEFNGDDAWPSISRNREPAYDKISENQFAIGDLLAQLQQIDADEPAQEERMRKASSRSRRSIAQNYNDLLLPNEPDARLASDKQLETDRAGWKWRRRTGPPQQRNAAPGRRPIAIVEQPPSELTFSNQSGAVVLCGVAYELAQGLARSDKQQPHLQEQRQQQRASSPTGQPQQQIQIKWEKADTGEELEQILHANAIATGSGAFEPASEPANLRDPRPPILRYVRASDGALVFEPFRSLDFRPDVHATSYRCVASVLTFPPATHQAAGGQQLAGVSVVSRDMRVRAVLAQPAHSIQIEVMDELVQQANAAVFKCQVPAYAQSYLRLVDWSEYPSERTFSAPQAADPILSLPSNESHYDERHFVHPKSGHLIVLRVGVEDNYRSYKCRCKNTLTGELISSMNRGKLIVSESHAPMAPKLSIYSTAASSSSSFSSASSLTTSEFNQLAARTTTYEEHDWALLVCHLQAFPQPSISWFKQHAGPSQQPGEHLDLHQDQLDRPGSLLPLQTQLLRNSENAALGHLLSSAKPGAVQTSPNKFLQLENLLFIRRLERNDSGAYVCVARNQVGEERCSSSVQVRAPLRAKLTVSANVIELGKSLSLECTIFGYPIHQVVFRHNQNVIKSISGAESLAQLRVQSANERQTGLAGEQQQQQYQVRNYFVLDDEQADAQSAATEQRAALESELTSSSTSAPTNSSSDELEESMGLSHVIVIVLEPKQAGAYQCFAHNHFESAQSSAFVRVLDDPPKFKHTFRPQLHQENQDISLMCAARANPIPEITWSLDDTPIAVDETNRVRFGDFVTKDNLVISYVNISAAQVSDGGLYRCTADNRLAQVAHEAQVSVAGEPLVKPMSNVTVLASSTFRKRCPVAGHPVGEIQWRHQGQRLPANHRQHVFENGTLEVEHMEKSAGDEGEYRCVVSGGAGSGSEKQGPRTEASGSVHVSIRARPTIEPFAVSRQLREGQRASIMCTISSGDLPIAINWFRNDHLLVPANHLEQGPLTSSQQRQETQSAQLIVLMPAGKGFNQQHAGVLETSGQPTSGEQQILAGVRISRVTDYSSTLLFESLLSQHSANYTCVARNDAGSVSYQAPMVVQVAPKWAIEPTDTNIVRGSGATIDCMATGFPPPRIIWTRASGETPPAGSSALQSSGSAKQEPASKQANELAGRPSSSHQLGGWRSIVSSPHLQVFENGSLSILDGRDSDFGHYMCQASNGVGPGLSKVIRVAINVAAHFETAHTIQLVARGEPARLRCRAKGDWPLQLAWFRNKQRLEPVNFQEAPAESGVHAPPPNSAPLSATLASLLLLPSDSFGGVQHNFSASPPPSPLSGSLTDQLSSWFGGAKSTERQYQSSELLSGSGQRKATGAVGGGSLLGRYSVQTWEFLITGPSQAPLQQVAQELKLVQQQNSLAFLNGIGQLSGREHHQQAHLMQINSLLTVQQAERSDSATFRCLARNNFGAKETTIQLVVQEPPDRLDELSVVETSSRSITLAWLAPYHGNAPILSYHVQYRVAGTGQPQSAAPGARLSAETLDALNWFNYTIAASATSASSAGQSTPAPHQHALHSLSSEQEGARLAPARTLNKLTINALRPVSQYWFRLEAENKLGRGPVSSIVETATLEEAPSAAPNKVRASAQSSSSILVSWTRLNEKELFGSVQGYYVAYKPLIGAAQQQPENKTTEEAATQPAGAATNLPSFKPIAHDDKLQKFDALLTGLKRSTKYMISVQAFNIRGNGPPSEPVVVSTLDLDPPRQLKLLVKQASNCSIELEWRPLSQAALALIKSAKSGANSAPGPRNEVELRPEGDAVDYYSLYQAELNDEPRWQEIRVAGHAASHLVEQLKCGTRYQFYMMGVNKVRMGDQSDILDTNTAGGLPIAPDRQSTFDVLNTTCYVVRLDHWQDNNCPIQQFNIRQRLEPSREWFQVAHFELPALSSAGSDKQAPISASSEHKVRRSIEEPSGDVRSDSKRSLEYQDALLDEASGTDDVDSAFLDYPAGAVSSDELNPISSADYMTLDSASSLISKSSHFESQQADPYNLLRESAALVEGNFEDVESKKGRPQLLSGRPSVKMPQSTQEWQASNFVVEQEDGSKGKRDEQQDWRRVRLCNLAENAYYTVQIRAQNRVGETEAELKLLTSPEGLEYDEEIKRHVVGRLGGMNGANRMSHSAISLNERLNGLMVLNQWPTLVPIMLTLTLVTIVVIIALLLRKSPPSHGGSPSSSSSSTTTTLTSKQNNAHSSNYPDQRPPPPPSSLGLTNGHTGGTLYHQLHHSLKAANGAPSAITTADGTIDSADLMLGAAAVDTYASVANTMPHHRQPFNHQHQAQHYGGSLCGQPGDKKLELDLQRGHNLDEITLANIYQKQSQTLANNQQQPANYQEDLPYGHAACGTGSPMTNLASSSATGASTNFSTQSPSTTAPLSLNSANSMSSGHTMSGHQTLPLHFHHQQANQAEALNVYLCAKEQHQTKQQLHNHQEATIFYALPPIDPQQAPYGQQVQMRRFQQDQHEFSDNLQLEQQQQQCIRNGDPCSYEHDRAALGFDPVYATIRRTFPQAFKYLTLQHHNHNQQSNPIGGGIDQLPSQQPTVGAQEMTFFDSNA